MSYIEVIVFILAIVWTLLSGVQLRVKAKRDQVVEHIIETQSFLAVVSILVIPIFSISPYHLLWMLPLTVLLMKFSIYFPLRLLWIPASIYAKIWYVGAVDNCKSLRKAGNFQRAIECYERRINESPNDAEAYFNLGLTYDDAEMIASSIQAYEKALQLSPKEVNVWLNLGVAFRKQRNNRSAIRAFETAFELNKDFDKVNYQLGIVYALEGMNDKAIEKYRLLKTSRPTYAKDILNIIEDSG
jgi:tetratricopeptide (TPR) repeat protein